MRSRFAVRQPGYRAHQAFTIMAHTFILHIKNHQQSVSLTHGSGNAVLQTSVVFICHNQLVNHHFYIMILVAVQLHAGKSLTHLTVYADIEITFLPDLLEQFLIMSFTATYQRSKNINTFSFIIIQNKIKDLLFGVFHHFLTGNIRISLTGTSVQQTKIIVYFRCRTYGGTRIFIGCLLLNGNHRTQACNLVYIRTFQIPQEVTGISGKGFNIPALAFSKYRIER